jgi:hypothetical protein
MEKRAEFENLKKRYKTRTGDDFRLKFSINNLRILRSRVNAPRVLRRRPIVRAIRTTWDVYNDMLRLGNIEGVIEYFSRTLDGLTREQVEAFNDLMGGRKYALKITMRTGELRYFNINEITRDTLLSYLMESGRVFVKVQTGSDALDEIEGELVSSVELIKYDEQNPTQNKDSGFFPYVNTSGLDLSRYQIYNQSQVNNNPNMEQCLMESLKLNNIPDYKIQRVKLAYISGTHIRKTDLKGIADIIDRDIILSTIDNVDSHKIRKKLIKAENKDDDLPIEIAIYLNHAFILEDTIYSKFSIDKYDELRDIEEFHRIVKINKINDKNYYVKSDESKINSLNLINKLYQCGYFKVLNMVKLDEANNQDNIYLDDIQNEQRLFKTDKKTPNEIDTEKQNNIYYADCESQVKTMEHKILLLGVMSDKSDFVNIYNVCDFNDAQNMIWRFLKFVSNDGKHHSICYFHNLKYDYNLIEKYLNIKDKCEKGGNIYSVQVKYKNKIIELRDSYKLISRKLAEFPDIFDLKDKKQEAINYEYYSFENNDKRINIDIYKEGLSVKDRITFDANMTEEISYDKNDNTFNPTTYYKRYLRYDVLVLKQGLKKFNELIKNITGGNMDIFKNLTISSLTDKYMIGQGCYDDIYETSGNLRNYISKAIYGGRVHVNQLYVKKLLEIKMADYDGVSLYPSAIDRINAEIGYPTGQAIRYTQENISQWQNKIYSILTVKIIKVNKKQQMPMIAVKTAEGIDYINEAPEKPLIIDSITLEDYINFHHIEYELIDGVYWNQTTNKTMGGVIRKLFNERLKVKNTNKPLGDAIKLMLNSAYGKTIMTTTNKKKRIITADKNKLVNGKWTKEKSINFNNYVYKNFNTISEYRKLNENQYEIEEIKADLSYNRSHIGCMILSMSKRIMNEVFNVANDMGLPIYYTDTDSLHCRFDDVPILEAEFKRRYNRDLSGSQLGQFHIDFDLKDSMGDVYAIKSIFLGKKSYLDVLESKDKNGDIIHGYHIRLKGITKPGLEGASKDYHDGYLGLYKDLANGAERKFILNPFDEVENKKHILFDISKGIIHTKGEFTRMVKF